MNVHYYAFRLWSVTVLHALYVRIPFLHRAALSSSSSSSFYFHIVQRIVRVDVVLSFRFLFVFIFFSMWLMFIEFVDGWLLFRKGIFGERRKNTRSHKTPLAVVRVCVWKKKRGIFLARPKAKWLVSNLIEPQKNRSQEYEGIQRPLSISFEADSCRKCFK